MERFRRSDALLLGGLALAGCVVALFLLLSSRSGVSVQVRVAGEVVAAYPLDRDGVYEIAGVDGGSNTLVIEDGAACISAASCPDGLCIHMGHISRAGQSIVCLPNQVVVEIVGTDAEDSSGVDLIAG